MCCVLCVVYHSSVLCQQSNANFFNKIYIFFVKTLKFISCNILNVFSSVLGFSMSACSVWLMWLSLWWSCCVFGAIALSFRWPVWAVVPPAVGAHEHVMQPIIKLYLPIDFQNVCCKKFTNKQTIIILKKIYIMFNETILNFNIFSKGPLKCWLNFY